MTGAAPPLGICTGTVLPGVAFGGFGPVSGLVGAWRGACIGGCGGRPMCAAEHPSPECSGCGRTRHGLPGDTPRAPWRPAVHALGAGFQPVNLPVVQPVNEPVVQRWTVLRPATEVSPHDPSLPKSVRALAELRPGTRVTLAVAGDAAGGVLASLAVRAPGIGYAVYTRDEGGAWGFRNAVAAGRPANVGQFSAALRGEVYVPPAPREAAVKAPCPGCGAEVSMTKAGAVYASHKCQTRAIEGRS